MHSKEALVSNEKSYEFTTESVTLKNNTDSSLLTKEYQELKIPESNQKQWQCKRKNVCVKGSATFSYQWHVPEPALVDTEQKHSTIEQLVFSVSKQ